MLAALGTDCWIARSWPVLRWASGRPDPPGDRWARAGSWWWSTSVRTSARHLEQAREK